MFGTFWSLYSSSKTIREDLTIARCMIAVERLKDYVVATLRIRCPVPGAVKCDEDAMTVPSRKLFLVVTHHGIRRPVRWKGSHWCEFIRANAYGFAPIPSVFRREHEF